MKRIFAWTALAALLLIAAPVLADDAPVMVPERVLGDANAPVTVEEFVSLTCPHCAEFYTTVLPKLKVKYVDTGKVKFILRDFPLDGTGLRAATLARCITPSEYYPFIEALYSNQAAWATQPSPDKTLIMYAKLTGLDEAKALVCLNDTKMQDAIVAGRSEAQKKYSIAATPTFVLNGGAEKIEGAQDADKFSVVIDKLLAAKK
jgi:protein-disulfide isomerase